MRLIITSIVVRLLSTALHALAGALAVGLVVFVYVLNARPDLSVWHLAHLDAEFTTDSGVEDFEAYLRLEDRLFEQLEREVVEKVETGPADSFNRFATGSQSEPARWPRNWNRTYQMRAEEPVATALLLHGLSDSPYSLHSTAELLHGRGVTVLGLRVPGHGTAPSGLLRTRWQDMAAAVRLAVRHLRNVGEGLPLYLVGYSNGGALAVEYALSALETPQLPKPAGLVLLSPEIGVTGFAALAAWQARLGRVLGLEKLAWSSVEPEYDPFKYNSFAVNAGDLAYRLTGSVRERLRALEDRGRLADMPPILAFQSAVDATVTATALVENLFDQLAPPHHELVLFDVNRKPDVAAMLVKDPRTIFEPLLAKSRRAFALTVVTNAADDDERVVARTVAAGEGLAKESRVELEARWPANVYSLAHIALPFSPRDPLYGGPQARESPGVQLGHIALRGETGVLQIEPKALLRMHWNPFFAYVKSRMLGFMKLDERKAD